MSTETLPVLGASASADPRCEQFVSHPSAASASSSSCSSCCVLSSICGSSPTEYRLFIVGNDNSGKTTLFHRLVGKEAPTVATNTIGFTVETTHFPTEASKDTICAWDMGGLAIIRSTWKEYYSGVDAIVFVVDAADRARVEEAKAELKKLLAVEYLSAAPLLIFANKQDVVGAMTVTEVRNAFADVLPASTDDKNNNSNARRYCIQGSIARNPNVKTEKDGLREGFEWVYGVLKATKGAGKKRGGNLLPRLVAATAAVAVAAVTASLLLKPKKH